MTPVLRTFFCSPWDQQSPSYIGTIEAMSVREAAGKYVLETQRVLMSVGGTVDIRVHGEGEPEPHRVNVWYDAEGIHAKVYGPETDSASEAIENMMEPLPPSANEVSEAGIMTISEKRGVYVDPDLRIENPIVPNGPPHPWLVFRVFYGNEEDPILVVDRSFAGALKRSEDAGLEVQAISRVDFVGGVERMDLF